MDIKEKVQQALSCRQNGDFDKAEKVYLEILDKDSENAVVLSFLGVMYYEQRKLENAQKYLLKAYSIKPNNVVIKMLGLTYYYLGSIPQAEKFLLMASEFDKSPEVYNKLVTMMMVGNTGHGRALKYSLELYKNFPFDIENVVNLSEINLYIGNLKESVALCNKALSMDSKYPKAWIQKGVIEEILNYDDKEARKCFKKALRLGAKDEAYYNLCVNYSHSDYKKSNYYGKKLMQIDRINYRNEAMFTVGTNYFAMKKMREGYKYYIHRWDNTPIDTCPYARLENEWFDNKPHKDKTLFLLCDLGFGDKIMFIRYLPFVAKKFKQVKVMCDDNIYDIFVRSFGYLKNVEFLRFNIDFPNYDYSLAATHLPYALNMGFDKIPFSEGYLKPSLSKVEEYRVKYFDTDKLKIGLCWEAGSFYLRTLHNRSLIFSDLEKLFDIKDVQYYSFQLTSVSSDAESLKSKNIVDLASTINNFDDTAGALMNLDVLLTVDTSVAHVAGALGVKTLLLLPSYSEWRWFDNVEKTEWYDSFNIFKQINPKNWNKEISDICENIRTMLD